MAKKGEYDTITIFPLRDNPVVAVSFRLSRHGWSKLQRSKEWKKFLRSLGKCQKVTLAGGKK